MRLVVLVDTLEFGGAERMAVDLALGLCRRGHQVGVATLRHGGPLAERLRGAGIEILNLNKKDGFSPGAASRLRGWIAERGARVVHTHNPQVHHYGVLAGRGAGASVIVSTVHGLNNLQGFGKRELLYSLAARFTSQVVAVCDLARRTFIRAAALPPGRVTVIYNGIPVERFPFIHRPEPAGFTFGTVGRLDPFKDQRTLLRAFRIVLDRRPACGLRLLGGGPLRDGLEREARRLGIAEQVEFLGAGGAVPEFLASLDAFVLSSVSEGVPLSLLEAMATGLPVITTRAGGIGEIVEDGVHGWLCPCSDAAALADAMLRAIESSNRGAMGARARARVEASFTLEKMTSNYEALFERLGRPVGSRGNRPGLAETRG